MKASLGGWQASMKEADRRPRTLEGSALVFPLGPEVGSVP